MLSLRIVACLLSLTAALPAQPKLSPDVRALYDRSVDFLARRQNPATGLPDGIGDIDVLQFALTLEHLEAAFYQQGFAQFPDSDFVALGLNPEQLDDLKSIQLTEAAHVTVLNTAIINAGIQPVQACEYNFGFTTAAAMVATGGVLENVGVSAYLGAASLLTDVTVLTAAAQILTVEARHQTFVRTASKAAAIPSPFDTPLGVRQVFSLAAPFIVSCPEGSNLAITPFPTLTQTSPAAGEAIIPGTILSLQSDVQGAFCAFTNGGQVPGGTVFVPAENNQCTVPHNLAGIAYVNLASEKPADGVLTDAMTVAGPVILTIT